MTRVRGLDRGERAALVVSECQNAMVDPVLGRNPGLVAQVAERDVLAGVARLAAGFRERGLPVVHATFTPRPDAAGLGTRNPLLGNLAKREFADADAVARGYAVHPAVGARPEDLVVARQHGVTPFGGTELGPMLRNLRVETVVLAGVSTNVALPGATIEAVNAGFAVVLAEDCSCGGSAASHASMVRDFFPLLAAVASADAVLGALA